MQLRVTRGDLVGSYFQFAHRVCELRMQVLPFPHAQE